jgi:nicotinate-nucleotide pyrophosphorylase (carboxylating)
MEIETDPLSEAIRANVRAALDEDVGAGDLTAQLIPEDAAGHARVLTREVAVLCGAAWFEACFRTLDPAARIAWHAADGDRIHAGQTLCEITGKARALLTAERPALNFLQTLSGVATETRRYVDAIAGTRAMIYDTRKTLPGLRLALKYAVKCGGGENQRIGLYDGILIKENHIAAAGGIRPALAAAHKLAKQANRPSSLTPSPFYPRMGAPGGRGEITVQIEVENPGPAGGSPSGRGEADPAGQLRPGRHARSGADLTAGRAALEASGGITLGTLRAIAETGVDRISVGGLTKSMRAVDLSMRFV